MVLDTNRYSVSSLYASQRLLLKTFADRLCIYHGEKLIATHTRGYDRRQDFEDPDHGKELLDQRRVNSRYFIWILPRKKRLCSADC